QAGLRARDVRRHDDTAEIDRCRRQPFRPRGQIPDLLTILETIGFRIGKIGMNAQKCLSCASVDVQALGEWVKLAGLRLKYRGLVAEVLQAGSDQPSNQRCLPTAGRSGQNQPAPGGGDGPRVNDEVVAEMVN